MGEKAALVPSAPSIPTVQCRFRPLTLFPDKLRTPVCLHHSLSSTFIFFCTLPHLFPPRLLLSLFFLRVLSFDIFGSCPQSCLLSWEDAPEFVACGTVGPTSYQSLRVYERTLTHTLSPPLSSSLLWLWACRHLVGIAMVIGPVCSQAENSQLCFSESSSM